MVMNKLSIVYILYIDKNTLPNSLKVSGLELNFTFNMVFFIKCYLKYIFLLKLKILLMLKIPFLKISLFLTEFGNFLAKASG